LDDFILHRSDITFLLGIEIRPVVATEHTIQENAMLAGMLDPVNGDQN
jgi:hypothetical protein